MKKIQVNLNIQQDECPSSPTFRTQLKKTSLVSFQGIQKVGKHGKSHFEYFKVAQKHQTQTQYRQISKQQLSTHTSESSAWLALQGIVYDVTVYLHYHPGGDILLKGCGKECDQLFYQYHSWVNGKRLLEKFKIGYL